MVDTLKDEASEGAYMWDKKVAWRCSTTAELPEEWKQVKGVRPLLEELVNTGPERLNTDFSEDGHKEKGWFITGTGTELVPLGTYVF